MASVPNNVDRDYADAKAAGYLFAVHAFGEHAPDPIDFFVSDSNLERRRCSEPESDSMPHVFVFSDPFKIADSIVEFIGVNVIDLRSVQGVGNECHRHQSMHQKSGSLRASTHGNSQVLLSTSGITGLPRSDNLRLASEDSSVSINGNAVNASDVTSIADFVKFSISGDRNRSPFFCESDIHTTGCPSGYVGSAIKDPSHASTFGGSAIMAAASVTYNRRLRFR